MTDYARKDGERESAIDTPERALDMVRERLPSLDARTARALDDGWASYAYMIDEVWAFRFPRSDGSEAQYRKERLFLPRLAPRLSVAVPHIEHVGTLPDGRSFIGHRAIQGEGLTRSAVDNMAEEDRAAVAAQIAEFLRAIHEFPSAEARELGAYEDDRREDFVALTERARRIVLPDLPDSQRDAFTGLFDRFLHDDANFDPPRVVTHGDLGGRHILMNPERRVEGVIDFGKVCVGYSDRDFHPLLSSLGESFTRRILGTYSHPDPERVIAAGCFYGAADAVDALLRGLDEGVDWKIRDGRNGMANALRVYASVGR